MALVSQYLSDCILNYIFNGTAFTPPTIYIALLTTPAVSSDTGDSISNGTGIGIEVSGPGYVRLAYNSWTTASGGTISNASLMSFLAAAGPWGIIQGLAICDAQTGGNILFYGTLTALQHIGIAQVASFQPNYVSVTLSS